MRRKEIAKASDIRTVLGLEVEVDDVVRVHGLARVGVGVRVKVRVKG